MTKSKSKKRKLNHSHRPGDNELTHEEIWDDSALLRSWNDAVAEYEFYHSIHAKGEDLDEVLKRYEMGEEAPTGVDTAVGEGEIDDGEAEVAEEGEVEDDEAPDPIRTTVSADANQTPSTQPQSNATVSTLPTTLPTPGIIVANANTTTTTTTNEIQTQTLENIKMAYYWAGYYSGLYDGQRQT